jgi:tRNA 2-thiouridine synthesizing protein A
MSETVLDVKGMNCPLPVLKANRALRSMQSGERLRLLATDRAAISDVQAFCRETGHALLAWSEEAGVLSFVIRKREEPKPEDPRPEDAKALGKPEIKASEPKTTDAKPAPAKRGGTRK